jgi:hypothetical protein
VADNVNEVLVEQVLKALNAEQRGENRYRGLCPAHDDHNPSLDIYINADGYIGFNCLSRHCKPFEINKAIKDKFGISVPVKRVGADSDKVHTSKILYPSHEQKFPFAFRRENDMLFEYTMPSGEVAFFVHRYEEDGKKQTPAWFSVEFVSKSGEIDRRLASKDPPKSGRPIYNQHLLSQYKDRPVLIVEGEKTANAAMKYKQLSNFVITTWSGGSKNVKASDWSVLKDRDTLIYFWPDHDPEGVKAMHDVAMHVSTGPNDNRLNMLDWNELDSSIVERGWDLADGCGNITCNYTYEQLWNAFHPYYTDSNLFSGTLEEGLLRRDKYLRKLYLSGTACIVDISKDMETSIFGVKWYKDLSVLMTFDVEKTTIDVGKDKPKLVSLAKEWFETRGDGPYSLSGVKFDPATTDVEIKGSDGLKYLNTFKGFPIFDSKEPNQKLTEIWLKHLEYMVTDPKARTWIIDYFADIFQHPAKKPGTALLLMGGQGVGKSILINCVGNLLGNSLCRQITKDIIKNNSVLSKTLLVIHDEFSIDPRREKVYYETLKNYITNNRLRMEEKYVAAWESDSFCRFAFTSNDPDAMRPPPDDRRFTIAACTQYWHENKEHFDTMLELMENKDSLAGFLQFLKDRKITSNINRAYNTLEKEKLWAPDNKVLAEILSWANGNGLPPAICNILGSIVANGFGDRPVLIPNKFMREYMENNYGKNAYGHKEMEMLRRIMPGPLRKRVVDIFTNKGQDRFKDLCFEIPLLQPFRRNIEAELKKPYHWINNEITSEEDTDENPDTHKDSPL